MNIDACMNLKDYFNTVPRGTDSQSKTWLIQSKFEAPVMNFANASVTRTTSSTVSGPLTDARSIKTRGMWHQYGEIPTNSREGIFISIKNTQENSLADVCGFGTGQPQRVGNIKNANKLEEAVVAIPFTTVNNRRKFFTMSDSSDQYTVVSEALQKYVFPPKFDYITNQSVDPIAMYIFNFSAEITKQDIADMWQNLPPDISERFEQEEVIIEDDRILDLLARKSDEIQWMVFKVKKRSQKSYEKYRRSLVADDTSAISENVGDYSYNWPYDYFSLVELVKIDETVRYVSDDLTDDPDRQG